VGGKVKIFDPIDEQSLRDICRLYR